METSPRLSLSYLQPQQAQKHVTVNEALRRLDALVSLRALSKTQTAEPAAPAEGDAYVIPASATGGDWSTYAEGSVAAYQDGAWREIAPVEGLRAWIADEAALAVYDGAAWSAAASGGGGSSPSMLGVNAAPDATNRLSVKSDAVLFSHDDVTPGSGDARQILNKSSAGGTASVVFQNGFSGRAEFGLAGDDDFRMKVSPDGSSFFDGVVIDKDDGVVSFPSGVSGELGNVGVQGADIASASSIDLGAAAGWFVHITGNNAIAGFGTADAGVLRYFKTTGAPLFQHSASLVLPGADDLPGAAGDVGAAISKGAGVWEVLFYTRADGTSLDYEEGTFTPSLTAQTPGSLSIAYSVQVGRYKKWKSKCIAQYTLIVSSFTLGTASGQARFAGNPFAASNNGQVGHIGTPGWFNNMAFTNSALCIRTHPGETYSTILNTTNGAGAATIAISDCNSSSFAALFTAIFEI